MRPTSQARKYRKLKPVITLALFLVLLPFCARADWINLSGAESAPNIAEIYITEKAVRIKLEIFVRDLITFDQLIPDSFFKGSDIKRPGLAQRMETFSRQGIRVITGQGQSLVPSLQLIEPRLRKERPNPFVGTINPTTGRRVPGPPQDKRVLYAELLYPLAKKPESLSITPPLDKDGRPRVGLGFIAYHDGVPILDYRFLNQKATVDLDWTDPWYSRFRSNAYKRWQQSGLQLFLYLEPNEVRFEVLARVKDLMHWLDLDLAHKGMISKTEFNRVKEQVGRFMQKKANTLIDGRKLPAILDRVSFVKYTLLRTQFIEQPQDLALNTAMLGVIITYLTQGLPQKVELDWPLYSPRIAKVPTIATDPAGPFPGYVSPDDPKLVWQNHLKKYTPPTVARVRVDQSISSISLPLLSILGLLLLLGLAWDVGRRRGRPKWPMLLLGVLILVGSIMAWPYGRVAVSRPVMLYPEISQAQAEAVLAELLRNVYRAFDFRKEKDVYDRLELCVSGELLEKVYLQNRKAFEVQRAGGARAKVKQVDISKVELAPQGGDAGSRRLKASWTALGSVGHWGHLHTRENQYLAEITITPLDGAWKMTGLEVLEEKRVEPYGGKGKSSQ